MPYATVSDVNAKLPEGTYFLDAEVEAAIVYAEALITARAGRSFGQVSEQTIYDVRSDSVVFPLSGSVDNVFVGETSIPFDSISIMPWGIRFHAPPGGAWFHPTRPLTVEPIRSWWSNGRGVTVRVVGTFGEAVSPLIKKATVLLALDELGVTSTDAVIGDLPTNVRALSVEGLSVTMAGEADESGSTSTGNATADRLIDLAVGKAAFVA